MVISDDLTKGTQDIDHVFHLVTIVADAKITLLEDTMLSNLTQWVDVWTTSERT
jgi:hypothetical protein